MNKILILLLLICLNVSAQNAKNTGWTIQELHYPEIALPEAFKTYKVEINVNSEGIKRITNKEQETSTYKNPNITSFVDSYIKLPGFELSETPDFILEFSDLGIKHILSVSEKKKYGKDAKNTFTGVVELSSAIKLVVKDTNGIILFEKVYTKKQESETASVYKNASITSSAIALSQIKKQYTANASEYRFNKNTTIASNNVMDINNELKAKFSSYYKPRRVNLFLVKKEEKYGIDNNAQVEKLTALNTTKYSDTYNADLKKLAEESLAKFELELSKIKDKTDKKEKKIYWSLLSNISGVYYALGNYDKAIDYAKLRETVDYNKKWSFNLEIAEKRKAVVSKNKS